MPSEIRVHGVSGTPPSDLLYTEPVTYDQGWDLAKIYEPTRDDWDVKAFHWGSLTSKSSLSAFWILLAPFAMANVAGWMTESPNVWSRIWIRIAGLSLTGIFFVQMANMSLDIPYSTGVSSTAATRMYAITCLVVVFGLGWMSTQSSFKPLTLRERMRHLFSPTVAAMNPLMKEPDWSDPAEHLEVEGTHLWGVHSILHRLRRLHLAFGMAMLSVVAGRAFGDRGLEAAALILAGLMMVTLALTTGAAARNRFVLGITAIAPLAGVGVLAWSIVGSSPPELAGASLQVSDDLTYEIALVLGISAALALSGEIATGGPRKGWTPMGLLAVATLMGGTLGLTGAMLVETYLSEASTTAHTFDGSATFVTVGMAGLVVVMATTFAVATFFPKTGNDRSRVRRGVLRARVILLVAGVYGAVVGAAAVALSCMGPAEGCAQTDITMPAWVNEDPENMTVLFGLPFDPASLLGWAKILMVAVPAMLIVRSIVGGLLNGQDSRRKVGILWDLGSFWPRWFHPLGPPAYGPYAVTRLQTVISEEQPDVLAAHSQGSLITAVALCLADEDASPGLFITYGSQLGDLYPALFPSLGLHSLADTVSDQVDGKWLNLWRPNDAIGGQVIRSLGSRNWEVKTGKGHSRYELTPEFCAARKTHLSGDLDRPAEADIARCWET